MNAEAAGGAGKIGATVGPGPVGVDGTIGVTDGPGPVGADGTIGVTVGPVAGGAEGTIGVAVGPLTDGIGGKIGVTVGAAPDGADGTIGVTVGPVPDGVVGTSGVTFGPVPDGVVGMTGLALGPVVDGAGASVRGTIRARGPAGASGVVGSIARGLGISEIVGTWTWRISTSSDDGPRSSTGRRLRLAIGESNGISSSGAAARIIASSSGADRARDGPTSRGVDEATGAAAFEPTLASLALRQCGQSSIGSSAAEKCAAGAAPGGEPSGSADQAKTPARTANEPARPQE